MREESELSMTEADVQQSAMQLATFYLPNADEEARRTFAAGLLFGATQE